LNKMDLVDPDEAAALARRLNGVLISATTSCTLTGLVTRVARAIEKGRSAPAGDERGSPLASHNAA